MKKQIYVFIGPSGSGKTTMSRLMKEIHPGTIEFISTTTRAPRQGEVEGIDYYFIEKNEFLTKLRNNEFVEHVEYSGNCYGLTKDAVYDALGKSDKCVVVVDINGYYMIANMFKGSTEVEVKSVFVKTKISNLFLRMRERGDSEEAILRRLDNMIETKEFENEKFCNYVIDNNGDLEKVKEELRKI